MRQETGTARSTPFQREYGLDALRVFAFLILILYHTGMGFVSWDWHVKSPFASETIEPLMMLSSPWRLSLLFLVSGAATAFLLERSQRPGERFLGPRSWRLLVPLIFGMLVIVPPQSYYEVLDSGYPGGYHDGYLAFWGRYLSGDDTFCDADGCLDVPTWNHLWFVAYLWVYTMALGLVVLSIPGLVDRIERWLAPLLSGVLLMIVMVGAAHLARQEGEVRS